MKTKTILNTLLICTAISVILGASHKATIAQGTDLANATATPVPTRTPRPDRSPLKIDLSEAIAQGLVEAAMNGDGLQFLNITLTSKSARPLVITISPGTLFVPASGNVQTMIAREKKTLRTLFTGRQVSATLSVACGAMQLDAPESSDTFTTVQPSAPDSDLVKLVSLPGLKSETFRVQQFAIWTITDNPARHSYTQLGSAGRPFSGPDDKELERIKALFTKAGIPLERYQALQ